MTEQPDPSAVSRQDQQGGSQSGRNEERLRQADEGAAAQGGDGGGVEGLTGLSSLQRLRDRVEVAAREMRRLRDENGALAERIQELEARPAVDQSQTVISLDHDPDVLRRKITSFIEAIDRYLEKEQPSP